MAGPKAVSPLVATAASRARQAGLPMSSDPAVGQLLAVLAVFLPARAKVAELGTCAGAGTAWITSGLLPRVIEDQITSLRPYTKRSARFVRL
jgi:predicted O-methyltransferase YrrM